MHRSFSKRPIAILLTFLVLITGFGLFNMASTRAVTDGIDFVTINYPTNGSLTNQSFILTVATEFSSECTYQVDDSSPLPMMVTGGISHSTTILGLNMGQHTITVMCVYLTDSVEKLLGQLVPPAYAQMPSATTTFTVVGTGSGTTITGSGSTTGGGNPGHYACIQNQCIFVSGFGSNLCATDADCGTATGGNQNVNSTGGSGGNANVNSSSSQCTQNPGVTVEQIATVLAYFNDIPSTHWATGFITRAFYELFMRGDDEARTFRPDQYTTRAEYAKVLAMVFHEEIPTVTTNPFPDVNRRAWYAPYALILKNHGLGELPDGNFHPHDVIGRGDAMVELITMAGVDVSNESLSGLPFTDVPADASYAKAIAWAYRNCIINGRTPTLFQPTDGMTRAEIAKISVLIMIFLGA